MRALIGMALLSLAACNNGDAGKEKIADKVEANADTRADAIEASAAPDASPLEQNVIEQKADLVRRAGEERADAIRNSQLETELLNAQQKAELVKGKMTGTQARPPR